jgi:hypothetical protein
MNLAHSTFNIQHYPAMVSTRRSNRFAALAIETPSLGGQPGMYSTSANIAPFIPSHHLEHESNVSL